MRRRQVYNYPLGPDYSLTDAPTYTTLTEACDVITPRLGGRTGEIRGVSVFLDLRDVAAIIRRRIILRKRIAYVDLLDITIATRIPTDATWILVIRIVRIILPQTAFHRRRVRVM